MKNSLLFLFFFVCSTTTTSAQDSSAVLTLNPGNQYFYEQIIEAPGQSTNTLFNKVKSWVAANNKLLANSAITEDSNLSIFATPSFPCANRSTTDFKMTINVKNGKCHLSASAFKWHSDYGMTSNLGDISAKHMTRKNKTELIANVNTQFAQLIASLQNAIQ